MARPPYSPAVGPTGHGQGPDHATHAGVTSAGSSALAGVVAKPVDRHPPALRPREASRLAYSIDSCRSSEASPRTAEIPNHCHRQAAAGDRPSGRVHSGTPRSVIPTAAVRCAKVQSASRPAGHSESGWSDNVSADVERTPDSTSSTENLTQTFRSRRPRIPAPLPRRCSEPVAPTGSSAVRGDVRHRPQASNPRWPTRGGTPYGPGPGRGVWPSRSGRRVGDAGTPAGSGRPMVPGRDEVSASPSQRCWGCRCGSPPLYANGQLHSSA